jgi:hypothetical protein
VRAKKAHGSAVLSTVKSRFPGARWDEPLRVCTHINAGVTVAPCIFMKSIFVVLFSLATLHCGSETADEFGEAQGATSSVLAPQAVAVDKADLEGPCFTYYFPMNETSDRLLTTGVDDLEVTVNGTEALLTKPRVRAQTGQKIEVEDLLSKKTKTLKSVTSLAFCTTSRVGAADVTTDKLQIRLTAARVGLLHLATIENDGRILLAPKLDDANSTVFRNLTLAGISSSDVHRVSLSVFYPDGAPGLGAHVEAPNKSLALEEIRIPRTAVSLFVHVLARKDDAIHFFTTQVPAGSLADGRTLRLEDGGEDPSFR